MSLYFMRFPFRNNFYNVRYEASFNRNGTIRDIKINSIDADDWDNMLDEATDGTFREDFEDAIKVEHSRIKTSYHELMMKDWKSIRN